MLQLKTTADDTLLMQLALPYIPSIECRVRNEVMNDHPENEETLRWAVDDLKLLGITRLEGLKGKASHSQGVDAVIYAIPGMNMVVRFSARPYNYTHALQNNILGTTKPDSRHVMQTFMEFAVPNRNGSPLYIELCALGKDVGRFRANLNTRRLGKDRITGHNRDHSANLPADFCAVDNHKSFGGYVKLIDTDEMDKYLYRSPNQSGQWRLLDEYQELTESAKSGAWFDRDKHHEIVVRQLERLQQITHDKFLADCAAVEAKQPHARDNGRIARELQSAVNEYIQTSIQYSGSEHDPVNIALDLMKNAAPVSSRNFQFDLISATKSAARRTNAMDLDVLLKHGVQTGEITAARLSHHLDGGKSLLDEILFGSGRITVEKAQALMAVPGIRENSTDFENTLLARALKNAMAEPAALGTLCNIPGVDLRQRASDGKGYLDMVADFYFDSKKIFRLNGAYEGNVRNARESIHALEEIMRSKNIDPLSCNQKDGAYYTYAKQHATDVAKAAMQRQVNMAWSQMRMP